MNEISGENEIAQTNPEQIPEIPNGLSAIVFPDLGQRDQYGDIEPVTEQAALAKLNAFLSNLNQQGVDIVSVFDLPVNKEQRGGVAGSDSETKKFAVVRKIPK